MAASTCFPGGGRRWLGREHFSKYGLRLHEAQEVVQETIIAVARQMEGFKYDPKIGSFKGWLLLQTRWRIADKMRKKSDNDAK
jgi:DNA-directed RNA polymerase specialized sigma24 family protein